MFISDPDAEVVALSPRTLMATNRYICEVCHKGFQRDQNLQLHRRGHNLPWKLKQRPANIQVKKRVYICPEPNCVHHEPTRALGDLTGIKKHFCRKHGEKKWKCDKCSKRYAVQSDWKAHAKICGTREYHCDCGTIFSRSSSLYFTLLYFTLLYLLIVYISSLIYTILLLYLHACRKDSFVTHRAFCDALTEEAGGPNIMMRDTNHDKSLQSTDFDPMFNLRPCFGEPNNSPMAAAYTSATALLQKAAEMGAKVSDSTVTPILLRGFTGYSTTPMDTTAGGLHASISPEMFAGYGISTTTDKSGLYDSSLLMHSSKGNLFERQEFMGGSEKIMTVDFLGGGLCGKRDYNGNMVGMPYSNSLHQQQLD
ncbi:putative transcription factor C2H2 family [Helianthus annuus]|nr:putative transcription factor C2H2 family [Helianthus annuus]